MSVCHVTVYWFVGPWIVIDSEGGAYRRATTVIPYIESSDTTHGMTM
jgi:hypothetical protein